MEIECPEDDGSAAFSFGVEGIGITVMSLFGILGNILSLFVLTQPQLKSSITWFLLGLSVSDLIFLILCLLIYALITIFEYLDVADWYRTVMDPTETAWLVYLNDTAQTASVYFTLAIVIQRFCVVRWPLASRPYCSYGKCRLYSFVVMGFAGIYQLQRIAFELKDSGSETIVSMNSCSRSLSNCDNNTEGVTAADDYENYFFRWPYMTFMMVLPTVVLFILNSFICFELRKRSNKLSQMSQSVKRAREEKERSITIMLFVVVVVFLLCQSVYYVMAFLAAFQQCIWESMQNYLISVDLFLISTNSSVNFLIYFVFGSKFREQALILFHKHTKLIFKERGKTEQSIQEENTCNTTV